MIVYYLLYGIIVQSTFVNKTISVPTPAIFTTSGQCDRNRDSNIEEFRKKGFDAQLKCELVEVADKHPERSK